MSEASQSANLLYRLAAERSGKDVLLELGGSPVLVIQDADSARHVLHGNVDNYEKNMNWLRQVFGATRLTETGDGWRLRQQMTQSYYNGVDRELAFKLTEKYTAIAVREMAAAGSRGVLRIGDSVFRRIALSVLLESFFDCSLGELGMDPEDLVPMLHFSADRAFMTGHEHRAVPPKAMRQFLQARSRILDRLQYFRRKPAADGSLLTRMRALDAAKDNDIVLEHELVTFFATGTEATAASMGWTTFLLARNPAVQERLREIADSFWAFDSAGWEQLDQLAPLHSFVSELIRIFPANPIIGRRAIKADRIGGHDIEAGQRIIVSLIGVQHDRLRRPDPWAVDIDFAGRAATTAQSISFSTGRYKCAGFRFAIVELVTFLATALREGVFQTISSDPPDFLWQDQLHHKDGLPVQVFARDHKTDIPRPKAAAYRPELSNTVIAPDR